MEENSILFNTRLRQFIREDDQLQTRLRENEEVIFSENIEDDKFDIEYNSPTRIIGDLKKQELINYSVKGLTHYYGVQIRDSIDAALKKNNARISVEYSTLKSGLKSSLNGILDREEINLTVKATILDALKDALEMNREDPSISTDTLKSVERSLETMQK